MSAEMYNFHEAIDEMQRAEEEVLDNHKAISDYMAHALQRTAQLLQLTRDVDYDQEGMSIVTAIYFMCPCKMVSH